MKNTGGSTPLTDMNDFTTNGKNPSIIAGIILLLFLLGLGAFLTKAYINKERQRDMQQWESRLALVADARRAAIDHWIEDQFGQLKELADNASLQLYLWQLVQRNVPENSVTEPAQQTYLRNLVLATADRHGFSILNGERIPANLPQHQTTGLALLDKDLHKIVLTPGMPEINDAWLQTAKLALETKQPKVSDLKIDGQNRAVLAFAIPVTAVLGTTGNSDQKSVGVLLGIRNAELDLFPLLKTGASFAEESEAFLTTLSDNNIVYLSPTADGAKPMQRHLSLDKNNLASASAFNNSSEFTIRNNYQGNTVLSASRKLNNLPWILNQQVDASQALRESNERLGFLMLASSLILLSAAALAVAAWRHGSSVRAQHQADELREKAQKLQKQTELLYAITDNINTHTLLLSKQGEVLFSNQAAADTVGASCSELIGKSLTSVLGPLASRELGQDIQSTAETGNTSSRIINLQYGNHSGTYQASVIPVERVGEHLSPLLLVLNDITQLKSVQSRHQDLLRNLVATLVHIVDLHDPYSAHHSSRMVEVANLIGRELRLSPEERQTLDLATTLSNLGKIMIPKEVLTKTDPLTDAEHDLLQKHVQYGLELLDNLNFEGQVLDTIAQKQEHIDGSGYPKEITGDQMLITGKILSVANAFVALVSPRAYREGMSIKAALDHLMDEAGTKYDRKILAALFHIAENRTDWSDWINEA
ncbi:MAG: HD domain-containing phosphohydrolase [Methylococcales bacterium]